VPRVGAPGRGGRPRRLTSYGYALLATASLLTPPASAQQAVMGAVRDGGSGAPVEGAMVVLLDEGGSNRGSVLTAADGGFRVNAPLPGRYRLRVDRIGYTSTPDGPFEVTAGAVVQRVVETSVSPVQLGGLNVEGSRRCEVRPTEGLATARVWEEARKALTAAAWTAEKELYRFAWMRYVRDLAPNGRRVLGEERSYRRTFVPQPFAGMDPEVLARDGFLSREGEAVIYNAPDALVLLSDAFLDTHCFALESRPDADPPLVGLRFEPIRGRRVPEVEGVVWLESDGARLSSLEYRYVNLGRRLSGDDASGELTFRGLPNGTWIVDEWKIRMPKLAAEQNDRGELQGYRILGYREEGGLVNQVVTATGELVQRAPREGIHGLVSDSLGRGAGEVRVWIEGTAFQATSDPDGVFAFQDVGEGVWTVRANHPDLEGLGYEGTSDEVEVEAGEAVSVRLELPSLHRVAIERCRSTPPALDEAIVIGRVADERGRPVAGALVRVLWSDFGLPVKGTTTAGDPVSIREDRSGVEMEADASGAFVFCRVPTDYTVRVTALLLERSSPTLEVRMDSTQEVVRAELTLANPPS